MKTKNAFLHLVALVLLAITPSLQAEIIYIDADNTAGTGNTVLDGSGSFGADSSTVAVNDGKWSIRTRATVNGGGILATNAGENATPRLATTFTLPGPGLYAIYGYFWNNMDGAGTWDAEFQLASVRPRSSWSKANGTKLSATADHFTDPAVRVDDGSGQIICEAPLGTWNTTKEGLTVTIYIDDPETGLGDDRTWYDGIGYRVSTLDLTPGVDSDSDGLDNFDEVNTHFTDPTLADTDGDGISDGAEVTNGTNPLGPQPPPPPAGLPALATLIQSDGAWSWFNDHTARFVNGDLYLGYVKNKAQKMAMTRYDFDTSTAYEFLLGTAVSKDDHDVPNITVLPDGKILSVYSRHNDDNWFFYRTSLKGNPTSLADWGPEQSKNVGARNTYSNTFRLSGESDKIYNFSRAIGFNPTFCTSTDAGQTWSSPTHFIYRKRSNGANGRPYVRYATNHHDRIDMIYTDDHPRESESATKTSLYHLYVQGDKVNRTDGALIKLLANAPLYHEDNPNPGGTSNERGTVVYQQSNTAWGPGDGPDDWIPTGSAWTWDVQYQPDGKPVCAFQVQVDAAAGPTTDFKNDRIYYYYARWDGSQWRKKFIAHAGHGLYSREDDYGGGMTIDPENPNVVYLSSNVENPFDLTTLAPALNSNNGRYEIYRGVTNDGGETWSWEAITAGSDADNLRPFVPEDHGRDRALVWFRGTYNTFIDYDCDVYGLFTGTPETGLNLRNMQLTPGTPGDGAFKWASIPGKTYKITSSLDLEGFPHDVATGIFSQGDTTFHPFAYPPEVSGAPAAFFRVEEE